MGRTIDGAFGPSTPFLEGQIEGTLAGFPFWHRIAKVLRDQNRSISQERDYKLGKALGYYCAAVAYIDCAYLAYEFLLK
jgi:hypothetical protein